MEITFKHFRFLPEQSVLYENREIVHLKPNQAALLKLLLLHPDSIFSKDEILTKIWFDKEVSEQVVFQTMSQLRAVLGEDVIKTFPKKGYKWRCPLVSSTEVQSLSKRATVNHVSGFPGHNNKFFVIALSGREHECLNFTPLSQACC